MYWPKDGMETYGIVQVRLLQEVVMATYTLRTFHVKNLKIKKVCDVFLLLGFLQLHSSPSFSKKRC